MFHQTLVSRAACLIWTLTSLNKDPHEPKCGGGRSDAETRATDAVRVAVTAAAHIRQAAPGEEAALWASEDQLVSECALAQVNCTLSRIRSAHAQAFGPDATPLQSVSKPLQRSAQTRQPAVGLAV